MMKQARFVFAMWLCLGISQGASAATTTLTFDEFPSGTRVTTQYLPMGILVSGGVSAIDSIPQWPANSGANVIFAVSGAITFDLDPMVLANVQTVSAFISGEAAVGLYAYDAAGVLVGQSLTGGATTNMYLSVTSMLAPIAKVEIHNGGATFGAGTVSFVTASPVLTCSDLSNQLYNLTLNLPSDDFRKPGNTFLRRYKLLKEIADFKYLVSTKESQRTLLAQLSKINNDVRDAITDTPGRTQILGMIDQLVKLTKAGGC